MTRSTSAETLDTIARAEDFIHLFYAENQVPGAMVARLAEIRAEIRRSGTYVHTALELAFGARVAWRNSKRCIGRLYWRSLAVRDRRHVSTVAGIFRECQEHLRQSFNGGRIRVLVTVFAPAGSDGAGPRIHNEQLIRYAGYRRPGDRCTGDPRYADFTEQVRTFGWPGGPGTRFDVLPLLIETPTEPPQLFELPLDTVQEVRIRHPEYEWFADLGLRWHAVPVISNMTLEIGGVHYTAAPFNGWYMDTEIGVRNLADSGRYDLLPEIADRMGLDRTANHTCWKDRALVELNIAVLWSFRRAGVTITDHHTESDRFLRHVAREEQAGRRVPADWSWIVPPLSGSATSVFHRYYDNSDLLPNFLRDPSPTISHCPASAPSTEAEMAVTASLHLEHADPQFNPLDPAVLADPYPVYRRLRETNPVYWHSQIGSWICTRHADCIRVLRDSELFTADFRRVAIPTPPTLLSLQTLDPPDQTPLRHLALDAVRAQDLDAMRTALAGTAESLLDELATRESFDFIQDFCDAFTLRAITRFLGTEPPTTGASFDQFNDDLDHSMDAQLDPDATEPGLRAREHFNDLVRSWLADPPTTGVLAYVAEHLPSLGMTNDEVLVNSVRAFFHAGFEVPSRFIGNATVALLNAPGAWESLARGEFALDTAIEELIRYVGPVQALARACTADTEIGGQHIREGDVVTVLLGAANRDPAQFADPETLRLDRTPNPHISFGRGSHSCLGLNLARIEAQVTFSALLRHPHLRLTGDPVVRPNGTLRGLSRLPVSLRPEAGSGSVTARFAGVRTQHAMSGRPPTPTSSSSMDVPNRAHRARISAQATCVNRLDRLMHGLGLADRAAEYLDVFRVMTQLWGTAAGPDLAESDVSSDGSPMEIAVGFDAAGPAVQFAVEPLAPGDTPADRVVLACRMMSELVDRYGAADRWWSAVADLFLPADPATTHVAMYGAELRRDAPAQFKVWFYPAVCGADRAAALCEQGLARLGLHEAWPAVLAHLHSDERRNRLMLFSLDLSAESTARVKLYFRHYDTDVDRIARLLARYPGYSCGMVLNFCVTLTASEKSLAEQPPVTCLTFTADHPGTVRAATLYVPMWTYAPDDETVRHRVNQIFTEHGRPTDQYHQALRAVADRPLDKGRGIHNYVAWSPGTRHPRLKVYLSPELRHMDPAPRYRHDVLDRSRGGSGGR